VLLSLRIISLLILLSLLSQLLERCSNLNQSIITVYFGQKDKLMVVIVDLITEVLVAVACSATDAGPAASAVGRAPAVSAAGAARCCCSCRRCGGHQRWRRRRPHVHGRTASQLQRTHAQWPQQLWRQRRERCVFTVNIN